MTTLKRAPQAMSMPPFAPMYSYGTENVLLQGVMFTYETKPKIVEQVLPKPLRPSTEPLVTAWFSYFIDPVVHLPGGGEEKMTSYTEFGFDIECEYEGVKGNYQLLHFITGLGHGFSGREISGVPKKQAQDISITQIYDEVMCSATNTVGEKIITAKSKLTKAIAFRETWPRPSFCLKIIPRADGKGYDVNKLVRIDTKLTNLRNIRTGTGEIEFKKSTVDPLHLIQVVKVREVISCLANMQGLGRQYLCKVDEFPTFGIPAW